MEATVAASVPPQTALSKQVSPKKNTANHPPHKQIISAAQETLNRAIAAAPPTPKKTLAPQESLQKAITSTHQSQKQTIVTAHGSWQNVVVTPSSPQKTLPAVQDFLQKAYETVQRSQQHVTAHGSLEIAVATNQPSPKIATALVQHSLENAVVNTPLSPQTTSAVPNYFAQTVLPSAQPPLYKTFTQESLPKAHTTTLPPSSILLSAQIELSAIKKHLQPTCSDRKARQTSKTDHVGQASNTEQGSTSKVSQTGHYSTAWPVKPKPRQKRGTSPNRPFMVAKRRQSPNSPKKAEDETEHTNEPQKARNPSVVFEKASAQSSSVSEKTLCTQSLLSAKVKSASVFEKAFSAQSPPTPKPQSPSVETLPILKADSPNASENTCTQLMLSANEKSSSVFEKALPTLTPKLQSPSVSETTLCSQPLHTKNAQSSSLSDYAMSTQSPTPKPQSPIVLEKTKEKTKSKQTPSEESSSVSENTLSTQTSVDSPTHSTSRVVQTYQTYKAQRERVQNPQKSTQSPKKILQQHQQSNSSGSSKSNGGHPGSKLPDGTDPYRRVLVSGFPPYTQSQDLTRVLSTFGSCQVDQCRNRLAVVTFQTVEAARSALKATDELCIYGDFIEIKPYTNPQHVDDLFRAYKKVISTQKGQDIIMPSKIDLSGDFYQQLENIQNAIRLTREQVQAVTNLYVDLEMVLQQEWPGCVTIPFGSIPTGLGIASSDADCYVELPAALRTRGAGGGASAFVQRARRLLSLFPTVFTQLVAIPRANTPIVKFRHIPSGFHCDVSSKTPLGAQNSKLIKLLLDYDPRLTPVAVLVKYWAKVHELSGTGRLTNYALTMMVLFYFQQPRVGLVPTVERLQRDPSTAFIVDHWNAGFSPRRVQLVAPNPAPVHDLLGGFFEFYAGFDFDNLVVCPFLGATLRKAQFEAPELLLPAVFARYTGNVRNNLASPIRYGTPFCVQDPFEQSHNVASSVCPKLAGDIRAHFKHAADAYAADRATNCRTFLRTILLTRPKISRERMTPTTKIFMIPRIRGEITDPDWRARVREIVLEMIFDGILKIPLKRKDEKAEAEKNGEKAESGKEEAKKTEQAKSKRQKMETEKYHGSTRKPVWRRRKNYTVSSPEPSRALVSRQLALTEQILSNAGEVPLAFDLELGFRDQPRNFYVYAKLVDGELEAFRGFVAFIHTAMFDWFKMLLRPHMAPAQEAAQAQEPRRDCSIVYERVAADPDPDPAPDPDPGDISRDLNAITLAEETDSESTDSSKRDPTDTH